MQTGCDKSNLFLFLIQFSISSDTCMQFILAKHYDFRMLYCIMTLCPRISFGKTVGTIKLYTAALYG